MTALVGSSTDRPPPNGSHTVSNGMRTIPIIRLLPRDCIRRFNVTAAVQLMKKRGWNMLLISVGGVIAAGVIGLYILSLTSSAPSTIGLHDGRLADCPDSPNCVCSQASDAGHRVEPISYEGPADEAWGKLQRILGNLPRTRVVTQDSQYLHAEVKSAVFRFTDDVEFLLDPDAGVIHVRSASRVGKSDLGMNRKRVNAIRSQFESDP